MNLYKFNFRGLRKWKKLARGLRGKKSLGTSDLNPNIGIQKMKSSKLKTIRNENF